MAHSARLELASRFQASFCSAIAETLKHLCDIEGLNGRKSGSANRSRWGAGPFVPSLAALTTEIMHNYPPYYLSIYSWLVGPSEPSAKWPPIISRGAPITTGAYQTAADVPSLTPETVTTGQNNDRSKLAPRPKPVLPESGLLEPRLDHELCVPIPPHHLPQVLQF